MQLSTTAEYKTGDEIPERDVLLFTMTSYIAKSDIRDKEGVLKLMVGQCAPYHLPDNVISATVGLQPECELPSSIRYDQFEKFGKFELGALYPAIPKKFFTGFKFFFISTWGHILR